MSGSGTKKDAFQNSGTAQSMSSGLNSNASNLYGFLAPELTAEASAPSGYSPTDLATMNTAAQQSAGGGQAAAVGQGALLAGRTHNAGSADAAIGRASQAAGENLSNAALRTTMANADLKQKQKQEGIAGLENLYGTDLNGSMNALGLSNNALGVANNAKQGFWQRIGQQAGMDTLDALEAGTGLY